MYAGLKRGSCFPMMPEPLGYIFLFASVATLVALRSWKNRYHAKEDKVFKA
jgi:hypothetical protein